MLRIAVAANRHISDADFHAEVRSDRVLVPEEVARVLEGMRIRTAERFVSALHTAPSAFAKALGWAPDDVKVARDHLIGQLRGHVDARVLDFEPGAFVRGTGAFPPPPGGPAPYRERERNGEE